MKNPFLATILIPFIVACNQAQTVESVAPSTAPADSISQKTDTPKPVKPDYTLATGLTQEEMVDDTLFHDGSKPGSWEEAGIGDVKGFKVFLKQVQLLVLNNDKEQLAKHVAYPLGRSIKNESDFTRHYDRLFSKAAKLSVANINFSQISRNKKGVMTEDGKVWFAQVGQEFKIVAINN